MGMSETKISIPEGFPSPWDAQAGLRIVEASAERVVAEYVIEEKHHQPYGIVHGGVHCSAVETVCSIGAGMSALERGTASGAVGLENQTSFVRAVRSGKVRVVATPLARGSRTQLWQAEARDEEGRLIAHGKVRALCLQDGTVLAGKNFEGRE